MPPLRQFANCLGGPGLRQPRVARINWKHPITSGLVAYYLLSDQLADKVTGNPLTIHAPTSGTLIPSAGPYGPDWSFPNVSQTNPLDGGFVTNYHPLSSAGALNFTIMGLAKVPTSVPNGNLGSPLYSERASSGNDIIKIDYTGGAAAPNPDAYELTLRDDGGTLLQAKIGLTGQFRDNAYHTIAVTKQGNGTNNVNAWTDGFFQSGFPATWSGTTNFTNSNVGIIGATDNQDTSGAFPGNIVYVAVWNRALSGGEIVSLAFDPWAFLIPPDTQMPAMFFPATTLFPVVNRMDYTWGKISVIGY